MLDKTCFSWVQVVKKSDMPANAKYLCLYLSTFMNLEHNVAWPSQNRISHETGMSKPTIRKWLDYLNQEGWLITRKKAHCVDQGTQNYHHNEYIIDIPQRVSDLLSGVAEGKLEREQRVKKGVAEGKQFTPNNNRNNNNNNNGRFTPPTLQEVRSYITEKNYSIDPEKFFNHYETTNWFRGKTKIKNWKACIRTWLNSDKPQPYRGNEI